MQDIEKTVSNISTYIGFRPSYFVPICIHNITSTVRAPKLKKPNVPFYNFGAKQPLRKINRAIIYSC